MTHNEILKLAQQKKHNLSLISNSTGMQTEAVTLAINENKDIDLKMLRAGNTAIAIADGLIQGLETISLFGLCSGLTLGFEAEEKEYYGGCVLRTIVKLPTI